MVEAWLIAAATLFPIITLKVLLHAALEGPLGLVIKTIIGLGAAIGAAATSTFCPALGLVLAVAAIILGELPGVLGVWLGPLIPPVGGIQIGAAIGQAIAPISGVMWWILILSAVAFILHFLAVLDLVPVIGTIVFIAQIVIPLIIVWLIWGSYVDAIGGITSCFGGGGPVEVPGTGGVQIGAYD